MDEKSYCPWCRIRRDNDFGIPGVREHALSLRGLQDAKRIHDRLQALKVPEL